MTTVCYKGEHVVPVVGDPLSPGYVTVRDGVIVEVTTRATGAVVDLGPVAILPGFVNAHTHLDLSGVPRPPAPGSLVEWLTTIVSARRGQSDIQPIAADLLNPLPASGSAVVVDIAGPQDSRVALSQAGIAGVCAKEVLGLRPQRYEPLWQQAVEPLRSVPALTNTGPVVLAGVSPHAPYSTAREVYHRCGQLPAGTVLITHWLESREEVELLRTGTGPMYDFLTTIGALDGPFSPPTSLFPDYLSSGNARWILVHGNYLEADQIAWLASSEGKKRCAGVIYCPRTHAYFGHAPHPFARLIEAGIDVALGTDSLASNPDLSVYEEARFLAAGGVAPALLLEMLTCRPMRMLNLPGGTLQPQSPAHLTLLATPSGRWPDDVESGLFHPEIQVAGCMIDGVWKHRVETG